MAPQPSITALQQNVKKAEGILKRAEQYKRSEEASK